MEFLGAVVAWLTNPSHWQGSDGIPTRLLEHVQISGLALLAGALIALPAGLLVGHTGRGGFLVVSVANVGRAVPSFAILVLFLPLTIQVFHVIEFWPALIALTVLAIPPIVTNAYVGIREVDRDVVEAARGMGMREDQILVRIELPVAAPVVLAGVRTSAVQVVATATLAAVVSGGGLGRYIIDGIQQQESDRIFVGALLVALLALATELFFATIQRRAVSPGLRRAAASELAGHTAPAAPAGPSGVGP